MDAVLSQQSMMDSKWRPVAFYSKFLSLVERNYKIHNKKILAIICTLEEWIHFLEGAPNLVGIWTDHKNLEYFITVRKLNWKQVHWSLYLACFDFTLYYYLKWSMGKPDMLSQRPDYGNRVLDNKNIVLLHLELLAVQVLEGLELTELNVLS